MTSTLKNTGRYTAIAAYLVFILAPVLWLFSGAFKSAKEQAAPSQSWIPRSPTLENFIYAFDAQPILRSAFNSLYISASTAIITVVLSIPAAYVLARYRGVATKAAMTWVLLSQMFPFILVIIPTFVMLIDFGLYDTQIGLIGVYVVWSLPFALWMIRGYVRGIPIGLEEAATIDGASRLQTLRLIIAPLLVPGVVATAMYTFISSWNEFFFALVLLRSPDKSTLSLMLVRFVGSEGDTLLGPLAAVSILSTIPSIVLFYFMQKRLSEGLLGGAMKG